MTKSHLLIGISCVTLMGCVAAQTGTDAPSSVSMASSSSSEAAPVEPYPMELTVEHFKNMTLSGTNLVIGRVLESNSAYTKHFVTYKSNGILISGTFAIPKAEGRHKLVILNHGYIDPAIYTNGRGLRREQDALARAGFAVFHTDYRKHAQSDPDPDLRNIYDNNLTYALDSVNAVLALRAANLPNVDASKVGMMGHSMGGGVTLHILVAHPELIDAAVLYAPVNADAWTNFARWRMDGDDTKETFDALGTEETNPEPWHALSQSGTLKDIEDPILLVHGLQDADVPVAWSNDLDFRLDSMGKDIRYITYPKEGHEFAQTWRHFIDSSITFFNENL